MSSLHTLAWHVEIKAAACDREASAGPDKAFGFVSAYFELISPNQSSVVLEDSQLQGESQEGTQQGWEIPSPVPLGMRRMGTRAELFVPVAVEEEQENDASATAVSWTIRPASAWVFPSIPPPQ